MTTGTAAGPERGSLALVVLAAIVLRLAVGLAIFTLGRGPEAFREPDSLAYVRTAEALASTGRFTRAGEPELLRTPGYPLLLAVGVRANRIEATALVAQAILGGLTIGLVFALARELGFSSRAALAGAVFACCEPLSLVYANKLLAETLFTAVLTASLVATVRGIQRQRLTDHILGIALLAAAAFVKPIACPLVLAAALVAALTWRGATWSRRFAVFAVLLAVGLGPLAAWAARNAAVAGYRGFSAVADVNAYFWHAAGLESARTGKPLAQVQHAWGLGDRRRYLLTHPEQRAWTPTQRYAWMRREGWSRIRQHPAEFARQYAHGVAGTLSDPGGEAWRDALDVPPGTSLRALRGLLALVLLLYYTTAAIGLWLGRRTWLSPAGAWPLLAALLLVALSGGPVGYHRLRVPVMPIVALAAGVGAARAPRPGSGMQPTHHRHVESGGAELR